MKLASKIGGLLVVSDHFYRVSMLVFTSVNHKNYLTTAIK